MNSIGSTELFSWKLSLGSQEWSEGWQGILGHLELWKLIMVGSIICCKRLKTKGCICSSFWPWKILEYSSEYSSQELKEFSSTFTSFCIFALQNSVIDSWDTSKKKLYIPTRKCWKLLTMVNYHFGLAWKPLQKPSSITIWILKQLRWEIWSYL